ncbi:uncharacterized protein LOC134225751 isoform X2 [Armigeres subalbatus]|uniref:uncharacterized protein LOC134225751 isoform X2 n=1 Tax=Armigeres subalbatus TaxID=124917 RepID=UPI002ED18536
MSDLEKAIEQKLADARAHSDKKDVKPVDSKKADHSGEQTSAKKTDGKSGVQKANTATNVNAKKNVSKPTNAGATVKKDPKQTTPKATNVGAASNAKKNEVKVPNTGTQTNSKKNVAKPIAQKASKPVPQTISTTKKNDGKVANQASIVKKNGGNASNTGSVATKNIGNLTNKNASNATDAKKPDAKPLNQKTNTASQSSSNTQKVVSKANTAKKNDEKCKIDSGKNWDETDAPVKTNDDKEPSGGKEAVNKAENNVKKEENGDNEDWKPRTTNRSKSSREQSKSPIPSKRNYYGRKWDPDYRSRARDSYRRSPDRRRTPPRRRSRSPYYKRSSRSPRRYDSYRRSPRRRSRSRSYRDRSRSRSYRGRSRSAGRHREPKALMAKKSFLDDLAVKFAQEGKEFPELEQYRCEINNQFSQYPHTSQFSRNAVEHSCPSRDPYIELEVPLSTDHMSNPIVLTDPYNAYPLYSDTQPMVSYPIQSAPLVEHSPALDSPHASLDSFQLDKVSVASSAIKGRSSAVTELGSQPSETTEVWTKQEVKIRIKQAIKLLNDAEGGVPKTGKFLYRAPTFHGKGINENRSPVLKSGRNPVYAFSCRSKESSDPFGNIPRKLKAVTNALRMDEGQISHKIFQRYQERLLVANAVKQKQEVETWTKRQQGNSILKMSLTKTTQTDPSVCTECLSRKIKVRYNGETQTDVVCTVDSAAQTKPMPVQAVSEFGSITELTPNQVRAVSELIKYIKLTATSGTLSEMRDSLREDQVYNLNSDLRTAYDYFEAMVENKKPSVPLAKEQAVEKKTFAETDNYTEPDTFIEDENFADEYEEFHKNFCDDEGVEYEDDEYSNPLLQSQPSSYSRSTGGTYGGPSRESSRQQSEPGNQRGMGRGTHFIPFNRRN